MLFVDKQVELRGFRVFCGSKSHGRSPKAKRNLHWGPGNLWLGPCNSVVCLQDLQQIMQWKSRNYVVLYLHLRSRKQLRKRNGNMHPFESKWGHKNLELECFQTPNKIGYFGNIFFYFINIHAF